MKTSRQVHSVTYDASRASPATTSKLVSSTSTYSSRIALATYSTNLLQSSFLLFRTNKHKVQKNKTRRHSNRQSKYQTKTQITPHTHDVTQHNKHKATTCLSSTIKTLADGILAPTSSPTDTVCAAVHGVSHSRGSTASAESRYSKT